jgi:hypothetical protein
MASLIEHFTKEDRMSSDEARKIVMDGLERLKAEQARKDAAMDSQERSLRVKINENHTVKTLTEAQRLERQKEAERKKREARVKAKHERIMRDMKVDEICQKFGILCLAILLLTICMRLNPFVSISLALGLAVFPAVDIYRLYVPDDAGMNNKEENRK